MLMGIIATLLCQPQHYGVLCLFFSASSAPWSHNFNVQVMQPAKLKVCSWSSLTNSLPRRRVKWQPYLMPPVQHLWRLQQLRNCSIAIPATMMMGAGEDDGMNRPEQALLILFILYLGCGRHYHLFVSLLMSLKMRMKTHLYVRYGPCPLFCSDPGSTIG